MSLTKPAAICLSDFHIGENVGGVSGVGGESYVKLEENVFVRKEFQTLISRLKESYCVGEENKIKYLIIMGDQWDLAVQPMPYSFNLSFGFFNNSGLENYFERMIYIPGNHDHHLWRIFQTQKCVLEPLQKIRGRKDDQAATGGNDKISSYPQVLAGYLDLTGPTPTLSIDGDGDLDSGNSFISGLTDKSGLTVTTVYPNLYVLYNQNGQKKAMLLTHGHLFDPGWNIVTDILQPSFKEMGLTKMNLTILEMLNSPVTEFWNYSTAMMGKYDMIETIYDNLLNNVFPKLLPDLFSDLLTYLKANTSGGIQTAVDILDWKWVRNYIDGKVKTAILGGVGTDARYDQNFIEKNSSRIKNYIALSLPYIHRQSVAVFSRLVFGHTHVPLYGWQTEALGNQMEVYNTGGWVNIDKTDYPLPLTIADNGDISALNLL